MRAYNLEHSCNSAYVLVHLFRSSPATLCLATSHSLISLYIIPVSLNFVPEPLGLDHLSSNPQLGTPYPLRHIMLGQYSISTSIPFKITYRHDALQTINFIGYYSP